MWRKRFSGGVIFILLLTMAAVGFAQESAVKGNLSGVVVDSSGAVVPQAKVVLSGPTGSNNATSGSDGRFIFPLLTPGLYSVRVERQGFRNAELKSVEVVTGRTSSVTIALQPGAAGETVEVSDAAVTVDTTSSAISTNLNDTFYSQVPVGRNVTSIFYASAGVNEGGGTGAGNPSISGGSGLENQYVADGVNITDGAFGGIGVYSRVYGSLSTGINLSFVKEVQVKTSGYEPQYGKSTGGLVQIVTKSGSNQFHGGISAFFGPQQLEASRLQPDNANRLNLVGKLLHQGAYDASAELGGYVPGFKDHLFFFGSFNPSWNAQYAQLSDFHGTYNFPLTGTEHTLKQNTYNYAGKLTLKLSDNHQIETSVFGDPTRSNTGPFNNFETFSPTTFSKLDNGTRNWVARYNATLSPSWLVNASFSWGHNYLTETPSAPDVYQIQDLTGCAFPGTNIAPTACPTHLVGDTLNGPTGPISGTFFRQGLGYYENTKGDNYGLTFDTQKTWNHMGSHSFYLGYHYENNKYSGERFRSGPHFTITQTMADGMGLSEAAGLTSDATFALRRASGSCPDCPTMQVPGAGPLQVVLRQTRGEFGNPVFNTSGSYHSAYVNDAWTINKYVTVNVGWRWEQQRMTGTPYTNFLTGEPFHTHYVFTDNWSPRIGLAIDPKGDRKTKIFGNFARYSYAIPLDMAIRSLSNELDFPLSQWKPVADANNNIVINPDGTLPNPILDDAHFVGPLQGASLSSGEAITPGTKMQYLQEWVGGVERDLGKGMILNVRYIDRRIKRIVEDVSGISPEAFQASNADQTNFVSQIYTIANPTSSTDLYNNPIQVDYPAGGAVPAACGADPIFIDPVQDSFGDTANAMCIANPAVAGTLGADGKPDGFVNPARIYKAVEVELNKSFSAGWQFRTNYRWSQLSGNYEGAFRNDNGQSDPSISSLFDFVQGDFGLLGNQFGIGWLNTDRRHIFNNFISYNFTHGFLRNLTLGTGIRIESGLPINDLKAHPAYQNSGEIPVGGRGRLGRTSTDGQADVHAEYAWNITEKQKLSFGADLFNITNQRTQLRVDQNEDRQFQVPNADFLKPTQGTGLNPQLGYQRPFYGRVSVKWIF